MSSSTLSSPGIPNSDEVAELLCAPVSTPYSSSPRTASASTSLTAFSDDVEAWHELTRAKTATKHPIQHRSWQTSDIFRRDLSGNNISTSSSVHMMTSSPPLSPSQRKKRKIADLDLGNSTLTRPIKAQKVYYGIDIHRLLEDAQMDLSVPKAAYDLPTPPPEPSHRKASLLWTEKYRAKKFTDLIGDERTHRAVMHWLKRWDQIVFPGSYRPKTKARATSEHGFEEKPHRKILMLTGPPGLGKTTLAHVCAKQAGYEVQEINASDERSATVVKGRIRDMVGTETVKSVDNISTASQKRKVAKPTCVIIDEVDGVIGGSGASGEGGFVKALIDLVNLDQRNSTASSVLHQAPAMKKKGDRFRLLRPLILVCNDVYHPSLRLLRQSSMAEVIHVRKAPVAGLISRLHSIFQREGVPCEIDGVRRLCEATWGISNRKEDRSKSGAGEGDMRGMMIVGEWVAGKLRATEGGSARLTRKWVEEHVLHDLQHGGGAARGIGRGGAKDIVERVFEEGAGFPKQSALVTPQGAMSDISSVKGVAEGQRRMATQRLRELIDTHGDTDRIMTDCFSIFPERPFQDDTMLSKPDAAHEWLHFHDRLSSAVFSSNEWELAPYLSAAALGFHHLFASPTRSQYTSANEAADDADQAHPFAGPSASWAAHEAMKTNAAHLQTLQGALSLPLNYSFSSTSDLVTDLQPYLLRMLSPNINPVIVGGSGQAKGTASVRKASEQTLVKRAINAMGASGVRFDRVRVSQDDSTTSYGAQQWIFRMEPPLDTLCTFETGGKGFGEAGSKTRYAARQVLEQEWHKEELRLADGARLARFGTHGTAPVRQEEVHIDHRANSRNAIARDFFGRPLTPSAHGESQDVKGKHEKDRAGPRVYVTFKEGFSSAVRKPVTLAELMKEM